MKDHERRELVNKLTAIAIEFHSAQQLRERISQAVGDALEALPQYVPTPKCRDVLRALGKSYPRTCDRCGLGPCSNKIVALQG